MLGPTSIGPTSSGWFQN